MDRQIDAIELTGNYILVPYWNRGDVGIILSHLIFYLIRSTENARLEIVLWPHFLFWNCLSSVAFWLCNSAFDSVPSIFQSHLMWCYFGLKLTYSNTTDQLSLREPHCFHSLCLTWLDCFCGLLLMVQWHAVVRGIPSAGRTKRSVKGGSPAGSTRLLLGVERKGK